MLQTRSRPRSDGATATRQPLSPPLHAQAPVRPLTLLGSGLGLPANRTTAETIDRRIGHDRGWTYRHSGVETRYEAGSESQLDLALAAATAALEAAGIEASSIGLVLFAAAVPYQPIPATAPLLQARLGIADGQCMAFDVNSTCLSFLTALDLASRLIGPQNGLNGGITHALIVSAEIASRALPWADDPATAALFGDGAAAVVVCADPKGSGIVATRMETHASGHEACELAAGGTRFDYHQDKPGFDAHARFRMDGEALYRLTARAFDPFLEALLGEAGWRRDEVDLIVPHQASPGALAHLSRRSGFAADRIVNIVRDYGNQIAASLPTALHVARTEGRLIPGQKVLMLGTSAGVSLGGLALIA